MMRIRPISMVNAGRMMIRRWGVIGIHIIMRRMRVHGRRVSIRRMRGERGMPRWSTISNIMVMMRWWWFGGTLWRRIRISCRGRV